MQIEKNDMGIPLKKLKIEILHVDRLPGEWNLKLMRIVEQTHRGTSFNDGQNTRMPTCFFHGGFILESGEVGGLSVMKHEEGLIVRSFDQSMDWSIMTIPSFIWFGLMTEAVKAYNRFYNEKEESIMEAIT